MLTLPRSLTLTPAQFAEVCAANPEGVLELDALGQLIEMTPTGSATGGMAPAHSWNSIAVASVIKVCLTRYSPLRSTKYWVFGLGVSAISFEVIWLAALGRSPELPKHLSILYLMIWSVFISLFLLRQVRALMMEPCVNLKVLMGATSGLPADWLPRRLPASLPVDLAAPGLQFHRPTARDQSDHRTAAGLHLDGDSLLRSSDDNQQLDL
jgi:hypothetical protein